MSLPARFDRKLFLTYALGTTASLAIGCSDDPPAPAGAGGSAGAGGTPGGGSGGAAGASAGSLSGGAGGSGGSTGGGGASTGGGGASGGGGAGGGPPAPDCGMKLQTYISSNHQHVFDVTVADVLAGVDKVYDTEGQSGHPHWVKLTAADFATLQNGGTVHKYTCNDGHEHEYIVNCLGVELPPTKGGVATLCEPVRECADTMANLCPEFP